MLYLNERHVNKKISGNIVLIFPLKIAMKDDSIHLPLVFDKQ